MNQGPDPRDVNFYYSLSQIGMEMVAPIVLGVLADIYLGIMPWGVIVGSVLGPVLAFVHLISMLNRRNRAKADKKKQDVP